MFNLKKKRSRKSETLFFSVSRATAVCNVLNINQCMRTILFYLTSKSNRSFLLLFLVLVQYLTNKGAQKTTRRIPSFVFDGFPDNFVDKSGPGKKRTYIQKGLFCPTSFPLTLAAVGSRTALGTWNFLDRLAFLLIEYLDVMLCECDRRAGIFALVIMCVHLTKEKSWKINDLITLSLKGECLMESLFNGGPVWIISPFHHQSK